MFWRRLNTCLAVALGALLLALPAAHAQVRTPEPSQSPATPAAPTPSASTTPAAPDAHSTEPSPAPAGQPAAGAGVVNPSRDQQELAAQGAQRPIAGEVATAKEVFSDDWWGRARPIIEMHGYFRTRAEFLYNFFLGRHGSTVQNSDAQYLFPIPVDQTYAAISNSNGTTNGQTVSACGNGPGKPTASCYDKTEAGANLRLRLNPEIHISDNLRILTQIDLLDNLVLGSTPDAYAMAPAGGNGTMPGGATGSAAAASYPTGYRPAGVNGYAPIGLFTNTQGPPTAGVNSWTNSIDIKRAWGEYMTPVGQLRFGRMPGHWGLGMVENSGDDFDSDYYTTLDRIMFVTGIRPIDLSFGAAWDFVSTGPTSANPYNVYGGQPFGTCNQCNINEWAAFVAHRTNPEIQKLNLARGDIVINGGLYAVFRSQTLDVFAGQTPQTTDFSTGTGGLEPRQAWMLTPDLWVQLLWQKLRFEAEAATVQGQIGYIGQGAGFSTLDVSNPVSIQEYGVTTQTEFRAIDDKLDLQFGFGWASGDSRAATLAPPNGIRPELNQTGPISTFQFHPDYRVDLIFYRHILSRIEGTYYFRPSVTYDFVRHADGEKLGGGAAVIWSRASEFFQTPGHARDLGIELNAQLYYQSKDGSLNDEPNKLGGFYAMLQYGVFFPLGGLDYLPGEASMNVPDASLSAAQTVRLLLGIIF